MTKNILFIFIIFVSLNSFGQTASPRTEYQAKLLIDSIHMKLITGADFKSLTNQYSEDPGTNRKGGKYSACKIGYFTPEFEEVVLKLKLHELSAPFKTPYGYHIAQLLKKSGTSFTVRHILITFSE